MGSIDGEIPAVWFLISSFGFVILDECHHLGAEVFSKALPKITTQYMLGLSATMERKDGLTDVFKMFIGEIVVKKERPIQNNVIVKSIEYFEEAIKLNPNYFEAQYGIGNVYSKLSNYNKALFYLNNAIKISNMAGIPMLFLALGILYWAIRKYKISRSAQKD